jgi:tubulin monoglycylase TTLL3/8
MYKTLISHLKPFRNFQDMSAPKKETPWVTVEPLNIYGDSSLWLLKPSDLNRGRGIKLFRTIDELGEMLRAELQKHEEGSFIVQKYIERPMLISGRKFDIRVWALITHTR